MSIQWWEFRGRNIIRAPDYPWIILRDTVNVWGGIGDLPSL